MNKRNCFLYFLLGVLTFSLPSCDHDKYSSFRNQGLNDGTNHNFDNGNFVFDDPNDNTINGTWTYKCNDINCNETKTERGTMFRKGCSKYGFDELGKIPEIGVNLQITYKNFFMVCEKILDDYTTNFTNQIIPLLDDESYNFVIPSSYANSYQQYICKVAFYFVYDNPFYYFLANGFSSEEGLIEDNIKMKVNLLFNGTSFYAGLKRKYYEKCIFEMTKEFNGKISNSESDYDKVLKVHDFICDRINYKLDQNGNASSEGYAHTMAGCASKENGVCECYAKTFSYLSNYINVETLVVTGTGISSSSSGNHAWNYAKIDNSWYSFDCTWDDPVYTNKPEYHIIIYDYFGQNNLLLTNHFSSSDVSNGYLYPLPTLSTSNLVKPK